ncbi:MAG: polyribonucleotide nucleotidyltransferase [Rickettsiales bacterium]|jgi:polyribonucleotide nucleotidyltransferase|nr:polyribonucleotide nucleotidyltransferase [Rickettsiales bacterium]
MFNIIREEMEWGGKTLSLETGKIGRQASSVVARMGDTIVMANVTTGSEEIGGIDFTPLTVSYIEKFYAAGQIPPGFIKRETKPSDREVLISRLIDRPVRPLFPSNYRYETNVFCTLLSFDSAAPVEVVAGIAASAALTISKAHFNGPIACVRVGRRNGKFILNPAEPFKDGGLLDLVAAGAEDSILMVESEVKELTEEELLGALEFAQGEIKTVVKMIKNFASRCVINKLKITDEDNSELEKEAEAHIAGDISEAYKITDKIKRVEALDNIKAKLYEKFVGENSDEKFKNRIDYINKELQKKIVREKLLITGKRIDGRTKEQIRPINVELDLLPSAHASALFTRGETQSLTVLTLGSTGDEQIVDGASRDAGRETFMLHYNFPPYSVGECGKLGSPGRREIGHGKLAWRGLANIIATNEEFPYTVRLVSEITESNGSSSMATVCAGSLALMAGGVPMKAPVAGIAMGLIKEKDGFVVLSDIMGDEDHLGDMDFKVVGTRDKITALQMDIKCRGVSFDIMRTALEQAKAGRLHILNEMSRVIEKSRPNVAENAPKMTVMKVPTDKIKDVIGSQGKNIKNIIEVTKAAIDIDDDGTVKILAANEQAAQKAISMINELIFEPQYGDICEGTVVKVLDVGAFVKLPGNNEGFVHISELANYRVDFVDDILSEGKKIKVKMIGIDKKGKPKLSYKDVDQKTGQDIGKKNN